MSDTGVSKPLAGVTVLECAILGPGALGLHLADLGADVIKIESPKGDYIRQMTWPIVEGVSLMHLHVNRGKRSLTIDFRSDEGIALFKELAKDADVVIEGMRPGALARKGVGYEDLKAINPAIVFCTISGYGMTGPYKDMPSHGIAYDTWAGLVPPAYDEEGFCYIPEHPSVGIHAGPAFGAMGVLAALVQARTSGQGSFLEIAQSDAAAYMDWYRQESWMAYDRPEDEVTGNAADDYVRRAPGTAGMKEGVRYQMYEASDGHVLFMASEQAFWKNFAVGVGRPELFEKWPGSTYADHARGNRELQAELREIFKQRTCAEWLAFGDEHNTPIAPVNTPRTIADDPQYHDRFPLYRHTDGHGADMLPFPVKFADGPLPTPSQAPTVGQHSDEVLADLLGWDEARIAEARASGALG